MMKAFYGEIIRISSMLCFVILKISVQNHANDNFEGGGCSQKMLKASSLRAPRLLRKEEAANYCGVCCSTFDKFRNAGIVPDPIANTNRWDIKKLDKCLDDISGLSEEDADQFGAWEQSQNG